MEQDLAEYCLKRGITKSEAVKEALEGLLSSREAAGHELDHPFIGGDKGDGSDVSGNIKAALRARFQKVRR